MITAIHRIAATIAFIGAGLTLAVILANRGPQPPAPASTPDTLPPAGWTEVCDPAAIGPVCRTYPPGDERWQPSPPLPPQPPLPTPWPGGEDFR